MSPVESSRARASAAFTSRSPSSFLDAIRRAAPALGVLACTLLGDALRDRLAGEGAATLRDRV